MKKNLFNKLWLRVGMIVAIMTTALSGTAWAQNVSLFYTLTPEATGGNSTPHNSYTAAASTTISGIEWSVMGNSSMVPWRIGGKNITNVDREVYSKTTMGSAISKVDLTVGAASSITVNSLKLVVASDANFESQIDEVAATFTANSTITFIPTSGTQWATGAYYKFVFNVSVNGNSNKFVEFVDAKFYAPALSPVVSAPTFSPIAGTYILAQNVTISTETSGATIYYTTDGTDPTTSSSVYSSAIAVSSTTTIKAIAAKSGMTNSDVATATYTIVSIEHAGTAADPYTVADARTAIDASVGTTGVYVSGIVCTASSNLYDNKYLSYYISDDGTTTNRLEAYNGLGIDGADFTSVDDVQVGDEVVIYGNLMKYNSTYELAEGNYLVSLERTKQDPTIPNAPISVAYGSTYTVTDVVGGEATLTSSNTAVATVEGLVISPKAVGTTTITIVTAENDVYNAGSATFELTVTAPVGKTEAPTAVGGTIFYESFNKNEGSGGNDNEWSGSIASSDLHADNEGWEFIKGSGANECAKFGSSSAKGSATTPALGTAGTLTLTFKAGAWNTTSEKTTLNLSVSAGTISPTSVELTKGEFNTYTATITDATAATKITFEAQYTSNNRFFLDEVKIVAPSTEVPSITYTIPSSGLGTFCSEYPLDLSALPEGVKAYIVTSYTTTSAKLTQIDTPVKGGVGLIIEGTGGTEVEFESVDCDVEPQGNLLEGTLAPTYVAANTVYGMKSGQFHPNNAGTIPANRAYLPAEDGNAIKVLNIEYDDATGIDNLNANVNANEGAIYNLSGQMVNGKLPKGIYIVNGKKILK